MKKVNGYEVDGDVTIKRHWFEEVINRGLPVFTCQLLHPVSLAGAHVVVDDAENVAQEVTDVPGSDGGEHLAPGYTLRAQWPPTGHVAAQHGDGDVYNMIEAGMSG